MNLLVLTTWFQARLSRDDRGASLVEYLFLVLLVAVAVMAAVIFMRGELTASFDEAGSRVGSAPNP